MIVLMQLQGFIFNIFCIWCYGTDNAILLHQRVVVIYRYPRNRRPLRYQLCMNVLSHWFTYMRDITPPPTRVRRIYRVVTP